MSDTKTSDTDDPANESETCCKMCGDEYMLREGEEPTDFCDHCAHLAVDQLRAELEKWKAMAKELAQELTDNLAPELQSPALERFNELEKSI